jgi:hypothetical protein
MYTQQPLGPGTSFSSRRSFIGRFIIVCVSSSSTSLALGAILILIDELPEWNAQREAQQEGFSVAR